MSEDKLKSLLQQVKYPGFSKDIVSFGLIQNVKESNNSVELGVKFSSEKEEVRQEKGLDTFFDKYKLTNRERQIASMIFRGNTAAEISGQFGISLGTAKNHTNNIFKKFGVNRRTKLLNKYMEFLGIEGIKD